MSDLILDILKNMQADISDIKHEQKSARIEMTAIRNLLMRRLGKR